MSDRNDQDTQINRNRDPAGLQSPFDSQSQEEARQSQEETRQSQDDDSLSHDNDHQGREKTGQSRGPGHSSSHHHHRHSHGRKRRRRPAVDPSSGSRRVKAALAVLILAATGAVIWFVARRLDERLNQKGLDYDPEEYAISAADYARGTLYLGEDGDEVYHYWHNFENYLIMGIDDQGDDIQGMADFLLLMSIDKTADTYSLLAINRDTVADIPLLDKNGNLITITDGQICMAHSYAYTNEDANRNQVTAVSYHLGELPISGYYAISMNDIGRVNHALGGVTVTITEDLTSLDPAMKPGATLTLTDEQAAKYLRARMSVGEGTNEERMARQRTYLESFLAEGEEKVSKEARHYYEAFEEMGEFADTNLTGKQISRIAKALTQNEKRGIFSFEGETEYGDELLGDGQIHAEFYPYPESVASVLTDIFSLTHDDSQDEEYGEEEYEDNEEYDEEAYEDDEEYDEEAYEDDEEYDEDDRADAEDSTVPDTPDSNPVNRKDNKKDKETQRDKQ